MSGNLLKPLVRGWFEEHPKAGNALRFALGGLFAILGLALKPLGKPWLPAWFPELVGVACIAAGLLLVAHRIRNPIPQGEREDGLFSAIILVAIGAFILIYPSN